MKSDSNTINPRLIEIDNRPIVNMQDQTSSDSVNFILDKDWAKQAFLISDSVLGDADDIANRYWSSASAKFTDTRIGSNIGINSRPQFTRYSDIRVKGRLAGRQDVSIGATTGNFGMGRYYSEAIDDPSQTIYLRFGVPQFNSLTSFLSRAFDRNMTAMARTGRAPSAFYELGRKAGAVAAFITFPGIALTVMAGEAVSALFVRPTSKFYTMKPTMLNYWMTVDNLVNTLAIHKGIFPKIMNDLGMTDTNTAQNIGQPFKLDTEFMDNLSSALPDMFRHSNYFDIYSIANKAQRLANQLATDDFNRLERGTNTDYLGYVKKSASGEGHASYITDKNGNASIIARINEILKISNYLSDEGEDRLEMDPRIDPTDPDGKERKDPSFFKELADSFDAEFRDGSQFAVFKVDSSGPVSEAFANATVESDLSQKLNSLSSQAREARFSFSEGNFIGDTIRSTIGAATDLALGFIDRVTLDVRSLFSGLAGSGFLDIPKHWQSSTATLPRINYTMQLISPYNNVISRMQNIFIPYCMLLAGTLPLSTGKQSYTSPFLCQIFDRGRCQIRLGMIETLTINRGTSHLAFDTKGNALAFDVSFTVVDLSSIVHMPVSTGKFGETDMTLDEDNILADYLAVLAGQDIYTAIYAMPKARLAFAKQIIKGQRFTSPAYLAAAFHESTTSGMLQYITLGAFNVLEGSTRGSGILTR